MLILLIIPFEYMNKLNVNEILTLLISLSGLFVSLVTLFLGWKAYRKFLNQKLGESQLPVVLAFVEALYQSDFSMWTEEKREGGIISGHRSGGNLFQLSSGGYNDSENLDANFPVFTLSANSLDFKGWDFMRNLLLPNAISKELYNFRKAFQPVGIEWKDAKKCIFLGKLKRESEEIIINYEFKGGYNAFIKQCTLLDLAIKKWLGKHGLDDLNQHVVNTSPFNYYTKQKFYEIDNEDYERYQEAIKLIDEAIKQFNK